jgi:predicted RNA-binding Zn ribbon-like protein
MPERRRIESLELKGGLLCLDFVNTVGWHASSHPAEWLHNYVDLIRWSRRAKILPEQQFLALLGSAQQQVDAAQRVYQRAIRLRESLYRLFLSTLFAETNADDDLALLNKEYAAAVARQRIVTTEGKFALQWPEDGHALESPLWQLTRSAVEVLTSAALERIHMCAGPDCGWLFFDHSKNRSRKWCDSRECGNRDRVRRHYQRTSSVRAPHSLSKPSLWLAE